MAHSRIAAGVGVGRVCVYNAWVDMCLRIHFTVTVTDTDTVRSSTRKGCDGGWTRFHSLTHSMIHVIFAQIHVHVLVHTFRGS